jgi:hypothetical protein
MNLTRAWVFVKGASSKWFQRRAGCLAHRCGRAPVSPQVAQADALEWLTK